MNEEEKEKLEEQEEQQQGETPTPTEPEEFEPEPNESEPEPEPEPELPAQVEKMLTQSQANDLIGKARIEGRESAIKEMIEKYGVSAVEELAELFGKGQAYSGLENDFNNQTKSLKDAQAKIALLESGVSPERYDDVMAILSHKDMDITSENIAALATSHQEWFRDNKQVDETTQTSILTPSLAQQMADNIGASKIQQDEPPATIRKLGHDTPVNHNSETEFEKVKELFNMR